MTDVKKILAGDRKPSRPQLEKVVRLLDEADQHVINREVVTRRMIQQARDTRYHFQQIPNLQVSEETLAKLEGVVEAWIRSHVATAPSRGKRL